MHARLLGGPGAQTNGNGLALKEREEEREKKWASLSGNVKKGGMKNCGQIKKPIRRIKEKKK